MVRRDRKTWPSVLRILLALGIAWLCPRHGAGEQRLSSHPGGTTALEATLAKAVSEAGSRLGGGSCRRVFSDFRDARGRVLQESLDGAERTGASYLDWLVFYDGCGKRRCEERGTLALTSPDSRIVYLCGPQFLEKARSDPGLAAALIIHEELHSLGLREDPPTSKEITAKVIERCGR